MTIGRAGRALTALVAACLAAPVAAGTSQGPAMASVLPVGCQPAPVDQTLPEIHEVVLGETAIDVSSGPVAVPVRARVTDDGGSGLVSVYVTVATRDDASGGRWSPGREGAVAALRPDEGDWWSGSVTVGRWDGYQSPWAVHQAWAWDHAGNFGQRTFLDFHGDRTTAPSFTIAPHRVDSERPYLEHFVVDKRVVDVRRRSRWIRVAARVSDSGGAGVASVTVAGHPLTLRSGTEQDGWWQGRVRVRRWTRNGYHRFPVAMVDAAYNDTWSRSVRMRQRGLPYRYRARSVTDALPPTLVASRVRPTAMEVAAADGVLRVAVRLVDARSGVRSARARLVRTVGNDTGHGADLVLVRGTRRDGWWRGQVVVPGCGYLAAGDYRVKVDVADRRENAAQRGAGPVVTVQTVRG